MQRYTFIQKQYLKQKKMKYCDYERCFSQKRLGRYIQACSGDKRRAMTLYRYNLRLSQEMFTIINCFEVSLRNAIDDILCPLFGQEWLKDSIMPNGKFTNPVLHKTYKTICHSYDKLVAKGEYSHSKLIASMDFGMWKYMFSPLQYKLTNQSLLGVFPCKAKSTPECHINQAYIFNELDKVNTLRNRIAHHEPICFYMKEPIIDTTHILHEYDKIQTLFAWMGIDGHSMMYGLDHIKTICNVIENL